MAHEQAADKLGAANTSLPDPPAPHPSERTAPAPDPSARDAFVSDPPAPDSLERHQPVPDPPTLGPPTLHQPERHLAELLHSRGQRVTSQRVVILRELRRMGTHVPVEAVYRAVRSQLPSTALPTVYATLELLVELGLARRIETGTSALYDARLVPHHHAVCRRCGVVVDIDGRLEAERFLRAARAAGFVAGSAELVISGLCGRCAAATGATRTAAPGSGATRTGATRLGSPGGDRGARKRDEKRTRARRAQPGGVRHG